MSSQKRANILQRQTVMASLPLFLLYPRVGVSAVCNLIPAFSILSSVWGVSCVQSRVVSGAFATCVARNRKPWKACVPTSSSHSKRSGSEKAADDCSLFFLSTVRNLAVRFYRCAQDFTQSWWSRKSTLTLSSRRQRSRSVQTIASCTEPARSVRRIYALHSSDSSIVRRCMRSAWSDASGRSPAALPVDMTAGAPHGAARPVAHAR